MHWHFVRRCTLFALGLLALADSAFAQSPLIYSRSTFNAASFMPAGIPGGAIAQGSIFTIFGAHLGPTTAVTASSFPLGTTLGGVSLNVVQGSTIVHAIPVYVSASQINAIMPSNAPLGAVSLQVVSGNARSNMSPARVAASAFGIFTATGTGLGPGILYNFVTQNNQPVNSPLVTAKNGQVITLWGTGLGPITGADNVAPTAGNLPVQVEVFVGGQPATVQYSGRSTCCSGVDQIVFTVPSNAPAGCWVPVYVRTAGTTVSNVVSMGINPNGGVCGTDVLPQITSIIVKGGRFGKAVAVRALTHQDIGTFAPVDVTADYHLSVAFDSAPGPFPFHPIYSFPPSGTCTVYTVPGDLLSGDLLPGPPPEIMPPDFGAPFLLTGPNGPRTLTSLFSNLRLSYLGGLISGNILPSSLYLDPGSYKLMAFGGMDIGPFSVSFNIPQPLTWTNRDQLASIDRTQPLTISWTGGDAGQVVTVMGFGEDLPTNSSAVFACIAPAGAGSVTIPPAILANLPPTRGNPLQSKDVIYMVTLPGSSLQSFSAKGLNQGVSMFSLINGKTVVIQ
jgi:uncharacterized protein (TIGR03437 family)